MATYHIDLDERGVFHSHVENTEGEDVCSLDEQWIGELIEDGFIRHGRDIEGLEDWLVSMELIDSNDTLKLIS